jgi:molybdopterin-guanine dinucleotide biosynthesis protein A
MGSDKALLDLEGKPLIEHVAETLQSCVESVIIIANDADRFRFLGLPVFGDVFKDCGPLGGIHSALTNAKTESTFVSSCDIPLISPEAVQYIIDHQDRNVMVTVPMVSGRLQPLCGVYKSACLCTLADFIRQGGRSVQHFVKMLEGNVIPLDSELPFFHPSIFENLNTVDDYVKLRIRAHGGIDC